MAVRQSGKNLQISDNDDCIEVYRSERDGTGIFYTKGRLDAILSITLLEKDPNHSEYMLSRRQLVNDASLQSCLFSETIVVELIVACSEYQAT